MLKKLARRGAAVPTILKTAIKSAESAVDDDGDHGYEISRRRFLRLKIQKVETCSILLVKRVLYIHELYY